MNDKELDNMRDKNKESYIDEITKLRRENKKLKNEHQRLSGILDRATGNNKPLVDENVKLKDENKRLLQKLTRLQKKIGNGIEFVEYNNEKDLINVMVENAKELNLVYDKKDLIAFHLATKTSNLTIIEGVSGTGKSQLVNLYAKTLGLNYDERYKMISVSPSWTEDTDILGYLDYNNMIYRESDTGLVSFLAKAEQNPNNLYLVCFDEMNLAKIEYYFAQFLSVLEREVSDRLLTVYNKELEDSVVNSDIYPSQIKIGKNVIFCGTINVDESTFRLSDKVLDRAQMISLQRKSFVDFEESGTGKIKVFKEAYDFVDVSSVVMKDEKELFKKLDDVLSEANQKFCIAFRTWKQINSYLVMATEYGDEFTIVDAIDRLIVQKVLPKIRGTEEQVGNLIGRIIIEGNYEPGEIDSFLNENGNIKYPLSRQTMVNKAKELKIYGYIS